MVVVLTTVEVDGAVAGKVLVGMAAVVSVSVVTATPTVDEELLTSLASEHAPMMRNETKKPIVRRPFILADQKDRGR